MKKKGIIEIHDYLRQARRVLDITIPNEIVGHTHLTGKHKEYTRMPAVALPVVENFVTLSEAFDKRTSDPVNTSRMVTVEDISVLLSSLKAQEDGGRPYPSGGAKYPVEVYVLGTVGEHKNSVFHYRPDTHALEYLWPIGSVYSLQETFGQTVVHPTAFAIIFTAVWDRTATKYGDFGYQLVLLEAGHMGQNVLLAATGLGVGARPFAGYNDEMITDVLDLDPGQEQPVYSIQIFA